jgi:hypothetical protein
MKRFFMVGPWLKLSGSSRVVILDIPGVVVIRNFPEASVATRLRCGQARVRKAWGAICSCFRNDEKAGVYLIPQASRINEPDHPISDS